MTIDLAVTQAHPEGEQPPVEEWSAIADTFGGRVHVEWDAAEPVTPLGQLPFCHENIVRSYSARRRGFECDMVAETFEPALEVRDGSGLVDLVEIGFAKVAVGNASGEHVVGGYEDLMGDGEGCAQRAASGLEAIELVSQIAAFRARRPDGGPDQDGSEMDVALAGATTLLLARTLVI